MYTIEKNRLTYLIFHKVFGGSEIHHNGCFWFFCPNIFGGGEDLQMLFCHSMDCRLGGGDNQRWWGHSYPTCFNRKKKSTFALTNSEDAKTSHLYTLMPLISGCAHAPEPPGETFTAFLVAC